MNRNLHFILNFVLFSKNLGLISGIIKRKKIYAIDRHLKAKGITSEIVHNRIVFSTKKQKINIGVWLNSVQIFFEYDNPTKTIPINVIRENYIKEIIPFEDGLLMLLKRSVNEKDVYRAV